MLIANLARTFTRSNTLLIRSHFARRVRQPSQPTQPSLEEQMDIQPVSKSEEAEVSRLKWRQGRQQSIFSVGKRAMREEEEGLEKEIVRLMNQNKTDQEIIEELSKRNQPQSTNEENKPRVVKEDPFKGKENFFRKQLGLTTDLSMPEVLDYQQKVMLDHIRKEAKREAQLRGDFYKGNKKGRDAEEDEETQRHNDIPDEFMDDVYNYKNNELKYLTDLVERKQETGKGMKQRRQKGARKEEKQLEVRNEGVKGGVTDIVYVQSKEEKVEKLTSNFEKALAVESDKAEFIEKGQQDLKLAERNSDLYLRQDIAKLMKPYQPKNSHSVQESRVNKFSQMLKREGLSMSMEEIKHIEKQTLFESKKDLQELQLFRKRLEKRLKRKKIKEVTNKINQEEFSDNHEVKQLYKPLDFNLKKHKLHFNMLDQEKVNEINKNYARSMFSVDSKKVDHLDIHTEYNMKQWIWKQLIDGSQNRIAPIFDKIVVDAIYVNDSNTTITIMWKFGTKIKAPNQLQKVEPESKEEVEFTQKMLEKSSGYMSGKMCQELKLRFGPLIKFKHKQMFPESEKAKKEMLNEMPLIIKSKLKEEMSKGLIPQKMDEKELYKKISTMQSSYQQKIENINFNTARENPEKNPKGSQKQRVRNNRNEDGSRKKRAKRQNTADQFWNEL